MRAFELKHPGGFADGAEACLQLAAQLSAAETLLAGEQFAAGRADLVLGESAIHGAYPTPI
jgi:hypothetical protein